MSKNLDVKVKKLDLVKLNELIGDFFTNCVKGNESKLKSLLKKRPLNELIEGRDGNGRSLLHYCAECSNTCCVSVLLKNKPNLIADQDKDGYTILHLAVINGNHKMVSWLCKEARALISESVFIDFLNAGDSEGHSAYHWAVVCCELKCVDILTDAGALIAIQDVHGAHPIHYAAQMSSPHNGISRDTKIGLETLKKLLDYPKVNINARDKDGRSPLLWAASSGSTDAAIMLVNTGADLGSKDKDGLTALHCSSSRGHIDTVETLLNLCGAEIDVTDSIGCSPLFYAVTLGHADCTQVLLENGAEPNRQDHKGRSAAHCGAARGQFETIKILANHGANLWLRNVRGDLPLHEAIKSGRKELVRWLLQQMPSAVNTANSKGKTPLHIAAVNNNLEMCKVLIDCDAEINPVMKSNGQITTPLDAALQRGYRSCAKFLLLHGALPASKINLNSRSFSNKANLSGTFSPKEATQVLNGINTNHNNGIVTPRSQNVTDIDSSSDASLGQVNKSVDPKGILSMQKRMQKIDGNKLSSEFNTIESSRSQSIITNVYVNTTGEKGVTSSEYKIKRSLRENPSSSGSSTGPLGDINNNKSGGKLKIAPRKRSKSQSTEIRKKMSDKKNLPHQERKNDVGILVTSCEQNGSKFPRKLSKESEKNNSKTQKDKEAPSDNNLKTPDSNESINLNDEEHLMPISGINENCSEKSFNNKLSDSQRKSGHQRSCSRSDSRCGHRLHYMSILPIGQIDLRHVRPKVDTHGLDLAKRAKMMPKNRSEIRRQRDEIMDRVEQSIRRHQLERKILHELQELKKFQISSGKSNEPALVKRLAEKFNKQLKEPEIGVFKDTYSYVNYEKFLYEQLRKLSKSTMRKVLPIIKSSSDENLAIKFNSIDQDMLNDPYKYRQLSASAMSNYPLYPPTFKDKKDSSKSNENINAQEKREIKVGKSKLGNNVKAVDKIEEKVDEKSIKKLDKPLIRKKPSPELIIKSSNKVVKDLKETKKANNQIEGKQSFKLKAINNNRNENNPDANRIKKGPKQRYVLKRKSSIKPIEAAINRRKFVRCKSSIPARFKINIPIDVIKNRWTKIKEEEKRRKTSEDSLDNIFYLYEINIPKKTLEMIFEEEVETPIQDYRDSLRRAMSDSDLFFRDIVYEQMK